MAPLHHIEDAIEINFDSITREHTVVTASRPVGQNHYLVHSVVVIASPQNLGKGGRCRARGNSVRSLSPMIKRRRSSREIRGRASSLTRESSLTRMGRERSRSQSSRNTSLTRSAAARDASLLKRPLLHRGRESSLQPCSGFCPTCLPMQQESQARALSRFPPLPKVRRPTLHRARESSLQPCSGSCRTCLPPDSADALSYPGFFAGRRLKSKTSLTANSD